MMKILATSMLRLLKGELLILSFISRDANGNNQDDHDNVAQAFIDFYESVIGTSVCNDPIDYNKLNHNTFIS